MIVGQRLLSDDQYKVGNNRPWWSYHHPSRQSYTMLSRAYLYDDAGTFRSLRAHHVLIRCIVALRDMR